MSPQQPHGGNSSVNKAQATPGDPPEGLWGELTFGSILAQLLMIPEPLGLSFLICTMVTKPHKLAWVSMKCSILNHGPEGHGTVRAQTLFCLRHLLLSTLGKAGSIVCM